MQVGVPRLTEFRVQGPKYTSDKVVMADSKPALFVMPKSLLTAEEEILIYYYRAYLDRILLMLFIFLKDKMLSIYSFMIH